jgi:hypothetical protein
MPTWICPSCLTKMNVKTAHVGNPAPCVACGVVSTVFDVDDIIGAAGIAPTVAAPVVTPSTSVPGSTITRIRGEAPTIVHLLRTIDLIGTAIVIAGSLYMRAKTNSDWWLIPMTVSVVQLIFLWLIYEFASDMYRCRRLLEEIAKK